MSCLIGPDCRCFSEHSLCPNWQSENVAAPAKPGSITGDFAPRPWAATADYYIADGHDIRDVIEAFGLNYNCGAIVKYIVRAGRKPGNGALLDLLKAQVHIEREIARHRRKDAGP
jgi:hypothetical protein